MTRAEEAVYALRTYWQGALDRAHTVLTTQDRRGYGRTETRFLLRNLMSGQQSEIVRARGTEEMLAVGEALLAEIGKLRAAEQRHKQKARRAVA